MWLRFFHIALRNLLKHKVYSLVNIIGLSMGLAGFILIILYIHDELIYDTHFPKADRIYRVVSDLDNKGVGERSASCAYGLGEDLAKDAPHLVEKTVRFYNNWGAKSIILHNDEIKLEDHFYYADSTVYDVFDLEIVKGSTSGLSKPFQVILSESTAKRYFGDEDPIGKKLNLRRIEHEVTAVFKDCPNQTHFHWDILGSMSTLDSLYGKEQLLENKVWNPFWTYALLRDGTKAEQTIDFLQENYSSHDDPAAVFIWKLQKITRIHLHSSRQYEIENNSKYSHLLILIFAGVLIYLISLINYINLSSALSASRVKEIGVKKVLGASQGQLMRQFLGEAVLISFFGLIIALSLVEITLPLFNRETGKDLAFIQLFDSYGIAALFSFSLLTGLLAGFYPAVVLSGFRPVNILKGVVIPGVSRPAQRKIFVTMQVSISLILFIVALDIFNQAQYFKNTDLGMDKKNLVVVPTNYSSVILRYPAYKEALLKNPDILSVTHTDYIPGIDHNTHEFMLECDSANMKFYPSLKVGHDFIQTMGLQLIIGEELPKNDTAVGSSALLINESMVKHLGYDKPEDVLGLSLCSYMGNERIIGVVKDFHHKSLDKKIEPFIIDFPNNRTRLAYTKYFVIKIDSDDPIGTVGYIKRQWEMVGSIMPFNYFYLEEELDKQYHSEEKLGSIIFIVALMSLLIASIGLFGLLSYIIQRKTKEMSIRRVLGARFTEIFFTLVRDYLILLFIGVVTGWMVSFLIIQELTHVYAYHAAIQITDFLFVSLIVVLSFVMMSLFAAFRITMRSPTESLSYE